MNRVGRGNGGLWPISRYVFFLQDNYMEGDTLEAYG